MTYPHNFLWGAATSSHQVEGDNRNNDWWQWEEAGKTKTPSGAAADHFHRYEEDFQIAARLGHNAHRFSIEWSRVEPEEGYFDREAISHYKKVLASLKAKSIKPVVTIHHFTVPLWFQAKGGWLKPKNIDHFVRYAAEIVSALGGDVHYWITINEPMVYALYAYCEGLWPPGGKSQRKGFRVVNNLAMAHRRVYRTIHDIYRKNKWTPPMVGFAKNYRPFLVCPQTRNIFCRLGTFWKNFYFNRYYLHRVRTSVDFFGVNYYELEYDSNDAALRTGLFGGNCTHAHKHLDHMNQLGWGVFPEGLRIVFDWLSKYRKPIMVTENGTCEDDDQWRERYIREHVKQVDEAVAKGIPVIGYLYWSLLDNSEWHHGLLIRFGLIGVDYETFSRNVRPSALAYHNMIKERMA